MLKELVQRLRGHNPEPHTVHVGSHEDRLSHTPALHVDPDDEGRTREDREAEKAERRPPPGSIG